MDSSAHSVRHLLGVSRSQEGWWGVPRAALCPVARGPATQQALHGQPGLLSAYFLLQEGKACARPSLPPSSEIESLPGLETF